MTIERPLPGSAKHILFATSNKRKICEAEVTLAEFSILVEPVNIEIHEIQHHDATEIAKAKARAAYDVLGLPVVVSDTSWEIPALGGFPGGYMKDVSVWLSADDWISLMARHSDRTIYCHEHVAYFDGEQVRHFNYVYRGSIVDVPRGNPNHGSIECVVNMYGDMTISEQIEHSMVASAGESLEHWRQFGEWYLQHSCI